MEEIFAFNLVSAFSTDFVLLFTLLEISLYDFPSRYRKRICFSYSLKISLIFLRTSLRVSFEISVSSGDGLFDGTM